MKRKNDVMIPLLAALVLIPQLLFWWLAPPAAARMAVYAAGTFLTVAIPAVYLLAYRRAALRRTAGLGVVCAVLELAAVLLSAALLAANASVRSALFAFALAALVSLMALLPLVSSALREPRTGTRLAAAPTGPGEESFSQSQPRHGDGPAVPPRPRPAAETSGQTPPAPRPAAGGKPLPPRKR